MVLPARTAWPLVLAFGLTLVFTGLVTIAAVSLLGGLLSLFGAVGWFREVLPHERHESVPVREEVIVIATERREVARIQIAPELQRLRFPIEVYPVASGIRGGLAGSVAMAAVAMIYGWISQGSIWYPVNLLGAVVYADALQLTAARLAQFSMLLLLVALTLHLTTSLLVGLLYGTMLPMLPRHPILLGGVIAPLFWSGLVYSVLGLVHPLLNARINWWWFTASQIAFGLVAGLVVIRHTPVRVRQFVPLAMRAGIEATGMPEEKRDKGENR
ncbi:MAG: hypothetical protein KGL59_11955 [Acidobacteriota bacterium]|nr:hypothetical protein [Acidobacteriota bacterium]